MIDNLLNVLKLYGLITADTDCFVGPSAKSLCGLTHVTSLACSVDETILLQITKLTEIKCCTRFHFMSFHKYKHRKPLTQEGSITCQLAHRKIIP